MQNSVIIIYHVHLIHLLLLFLCYHLLRYSPYLLGGHEALLHIFGDREDIRMELTDLRRGKSQLQQIVNGLVNENLELKSRIARAEEKLAELERLIRELVG